MNKSMGKNVRQIFHVCNIYELILGVILSICCILGKNYRNYGSYRVGGGKTAEDIILFFLLLLIIIGVIRLLDFLLSKMFCCRCSKIEKLFCRMNSRMFFAVLVIIFLVLWIPYFIIQFPGSSWWDTGNQINQFFGATRFDGMNPIFQTFLTGVCIKLGLACGSANYGVALYIIVQLIFAALVLAYGVKSLYEVCKSSAVIIYSVLFWGINPVVPLYLTAMGKDANWSMAIFLLLVCFIKVSVNSETLSVDKTVQILYPLSFIFVCLLRNAGIAIAVIFSICMIYKSKEKAKGRAMFLSVASIAFILVFHITSSIALNIDHSRNEKENLSMPLLQVARYVNEYPEEVAMEDKQVIDNIVSYDAMINEYNPEISDSIKDTYRVNAATEDKKKFRNLYFKYFGKHPIVFLDAIGAKSIGYFDPFTESSAKPFLVLGLRGISELIDESTGIFVYNYFDLDLIENYIEMLRNTPVLRMITRCGFWMWLFLFAFAESLKYKTKRLAFLPTLVFVAGLTFTPVNAYFRYSLPLVFAGPLYLAVVYVFPKKQTAQEKA